MLARAAAVTLALTVAGALPAQTDSTPLDRATWLAGCWEGASGTRVVEERWSPARGGTMVGSARTVRGDSTTSIELAVLRPSGDTLRYEAHPVGQAPAVFRGVPAAAGPLIFENPQHDFPQRIIYRPVGADSLHARIEGPMGGEWRGIDYRMARVRCDP